jgi:hypothetical protein
VDGTASFTVDAGANLALMLNAAAAIARSGLAAASPAIGLDIPPLVNSRDPLPHVSVQHLDIDAGDGPLSSHRQLIDFASQYGEDSAIAATKEASP